MTAKHGTASQMFGTVFATVLLTAVPCTAFAQASPNADRAKEAYRNVPPPKPKRATAARSTSPSSDYWSVNYAVPTSYGGSERSAPTPTRRDTTPAGIGRIPLQSGQGSIGFDSQSRVSPNVPGGADPNTRNESGYAGISLSVPSVTKQLAIPLPVFGRPE